MITIRYKCQCMKAERTISIRERRLDEPDPAKWMHFMGKMISIDHHQASPLCRATKMEYVKIPTDENTPVGRRPLDPTSA